VDLFTASNGEEALETIRQEQPNLVFLDVMMPRKNGFDVCNAVKNELGLGHIHIVLLTAKGQEFDRKRGQEVGALRRETSHDPGEILSGLNNALIVQGQLGFTTACCIRISLSGEYTLANAGHIAPYLSGRELDTPPALPLGLIPEQTNKPMG
jgi:two-component system alkaline phosphatase synthesis response regulator PhoP